MSDCVLASAGGCRYPSACNGTCLARLTLWETCSVCNGVGIFPGPFLMSELPAGVHIWKCANCDATGRVPSGG